METINQEIPSEIDDSITDLILNVLPECFSENYLSGLITSLTVNTDVIVQVLDQIPQLRNLELADSNTLSLISQENGSPRYSNESDELLINRMEHNFDLWRYSGSRYGLSLALADAGFSVDDTNFSYGIEERVLPIDPNSVLAIWADSDDLNSFKSIVWGHFIWPESDDGVPEIDMNGLFTLYLKDPDGSLDTDTNKELIKSVVKRYGKCTRALYQIKYTNGSGVVTSTRTLISF